MANGEIQSPQPAAPQPAPQAAQGAQEPPPPSSQEIDHALPDQDEPGSKLIPQFFYPTPEHREPYIFPTGLSPPHHWARDSHRVEAIRAHGQAAPGPWAPQIDEVRNLVRKNAEYFARSGSRQSAMRAARMFAYNDKYWKDYLQTKITLANLSHAKYVVEQDEFNQTIREEFRQYADAFAVFGHDPSDAEKLKQKLIELTYRFGDDNLRKEIEKYGTKNVQTIIADRVNHNESLLHIAEQRRNVEKLEREIEAQKERERRRTRILGPDAADPAAPDSTAAPDTTAVPATAAPATAAPATAAPATAAPATAAPGTALPPVPATPAVPPSPTTAAPGTRTIGTPASSEYIAHNYTMPAATPELELLSRRVFESGKDYKDPHKDDEIESAVNNRAALRQQKLDAIEHDPNLVGRDNVVAAVRGLSPTLAGELENYLDKKMPIGTVSARSPRTNLIIRLGTKADPTSTPEAYTNRVNAEKSATSGAIYRQVVPIGTAYKHLYTYEQSVQKYIELPIGEQLAIQSFGTSRWNDYLKALPLWQRPVVNREGQELAAELDNGKNIALNEVYKATSGSIAEIGYRHARELGDWRTMSNAALAHSVNNLRDYLGSRLDVQRQAFEAAGGTGKFLDLFKPGGPARERENAAKLDDPASVNDLNAIPGITNPPPRVTAFPETPAGDSPVGTVRSGKDGKRYRKTRAGTDFNRESWEEVK